MHAEGKPVSRAGDAVWDSDAVLHRTAELTIGYSGAELANLLNEAAILMVRRPAHLLTSCPGCRDVAQQRLFWQVSPPMLRTSAKHFLGAPWV